MNEMNEREVVVVTSICERMGYGRVMQIAAEEWRKLDPIGAKTVGPCACYEDETISISPAVLDDIKYVAEMAKMYAQTNATVVRTERVQAWLASVSNDEPGVVK